mmetsp:Transcript_45535/g.105556  ORF Transcript_45535/g.105556 Transcript_45535/m.105556 type:complete len:80 (+) Transcript_45535:1612-1851(+)
MGILHCCEPALGIADPHHLMAPQLTALAAEGAVALQGCLTKQHGPELPAGNMAAPGTGWGDGVLIGIWFPLKWIGVEMQ